MLGLPVDAWPIVGAVVFVLVALIFNGLRHRDPAWVIAGSVAGCAILFLGVGWAGSIGSDALWAALIAAAGVALWGQVEYLHRLRSRSRS